MRPPVHVPHPAMTIAGPAMPVTSSPMGPSTITEDPLSRPAAWSARRWKMTSCLEVLERRAADGARR